MQLSVCLKLLFWAKVIIHETNVKIKFLRKLKLATERLLNDWELSNESFKNYH